MEKSAKIYVAGHRGLVGAALVRTLRAQGYENLLLRTHAELDLQDQAATNAFFASEKPDYVFLAAAKVGGIHANNEYPADFVFSNIAIQTNVVHAAWMHKVNRLVFLGSSCIYPKLAPQPMRESYLLSGPLEPTNRPYALAKIAGIEMCWSYNRQYGTRYLSVMPTNLYGPGDNYHPENSHVIPALIRKFHVAKVTKAPKVEVWGTGEPRREFLYSDDMAAACVFLMNLEAVVYDRLLGSDESKTGQFDPPMVNVGCGRDQSIRELAQAVAQAVGYDGQIEFDATKPDGTPRKLLDVSRMSALGWTATTPIELGLKQAYADFLAHHA